MIEIILALLLATCPACKHIGPNHIHNHGQITIMSDEGGGETGHTPPPPPPPPPPPRP